MNKSTKSEKKRVKVNPYDKHIQKPRGCTIHIIWAIIFTILWHAFLYLAFVDRDEELCPCCSRHEYRRHDIEDINYRQYPKRGERNRNDYEQRRYV